MKKKIKRCVDSNRAMEKVLVFMVLFGALIIAQVPASIQAETYDGYLMAHFTGESSTGEQIYFATSTDGLHWKDLNNSKPVLISDIGEKGVRDPSLIRSADGKKFWILATDLRIANKKGWNVAMHSGSTSLVIWESSDLVNWSEPWLADVAGAIPSAGCAWAPEAIYDEENKNYVVYWATISPLDNIDKARIYYATTSDFKNYSAPKMYINRPGKQGIIDTQIIKVQNSTYKYYRASGDGQITIEGGNSILGDWTNIGNISHLGLTGRDAEGPILYKFNGVNKWGLMVDLYRKGTGYLPLVSEEMFDPNNFKRTNPSEYSLGTSRKRHGSILSITTAELNAVSEKWNSAATLKQVPDPVAVPTSDVVE